MHTITEAHGDSQYEGDEGGVEPMQDHAKACDFPAYHTAHKGNQVRL